MYRHSNYRRMPLTAQQEHWLEEREAERVKKSEAAAKEIRDAAAAKDDKGKKDDKKDAKKDAKKTVELIPEKPKSLFKSAGEFMSVRFPDFEGGDELDAMGPMRLQQLSEVGRIMECCENVKESVLRKALVIPQDRPEAICLEELRENKDGLMLNPNPEEYWRKFKVAKGKKGKGKKKK
jgi:hypothetical protein